MTPELILPRGYRRRRRRLIDPAECAGIGLGLDVKLGSAGGGIVISSPLQLPNLVAWLRLDLGITLLLSSVTATGTAPPAVTIMGTPASNVQTVEIDITGTGALGVPFQWLMNGVVQQTGQTTTASFPLGTTGLTASFPVGAYTNNDVYKVSVTLFHSADQSGNGNTFTQPVEASQPFYNSTDPLFGGLPSVNASAGLSIAGSFTVPQPNTSYIVARQALSAGGAEVFDGSTRQSIGNNSSGYYAFAGALANYAGLARDTNAHAFCVAYNGAGSMFYVDHSSTGQAVSLGANSIVNPSIPGAFGVTGGAVAELIMCSGIHSPSTVQSVFTYFRRYGIAVS